MDLIKLRQENATRWENCHIPADKGPAFKSVADVLLKNKARYQNVSDILSKQGYTIPWYVIAVIHYREAGFSNSQPRWDTYLGNGQPLHQRTTGVPVGRGPFDTWEAGAADALVFAPPYAGKNKDWSIGGTLTILEQYNGLGYFEMGKPSPYIWAGTNEYISGKYIADGQYNPSVIDQQLGCAGLLKFMGAFKTAPTGAGTTAGAIVVAAGTATAASNQTYWDWALAHWPAILFTVLGLSFFIDLVFAIYNNEKNNLQVSNVAVSHN